MKRFSRRLLGAMLGLALGWWLAGLAGDRVPVASVSRAADSHTETTPAATGHEHDAHAGAEHAGEHGDSHGHEAFADPNFVPGEGQTDWYRGVLWAIAGLFVAAIVIGIPTGKLKPDEPEDVVLIPAPDAKHH